MDKEYSFEEGKLLVTEPVITRHSIEELTTKLEAVQYDIERISALLVIKQDEVSQIEELINKYELLKQK